MKKLSVFAVAALALAFASCTQEMDFTPSDPSLTVLTATHLSTRSALEQTLGGTLPSTILWDAPDQIMVGYAGTALSTFVSDNTTPASEADFTGHLPEGSGPLYSIYPVNEGNAVSADGVFTVTFKGEQTAVEGSYDPEAFPSVAVSDTKELSFQNICGLLVLKVGYDDVTGISLSGAAAGDVFCGGAMTVELEGGVPVVKGGTEDLTEIVLNAPGAGVFSTDKTYYMAVPPCSLPGGAVFTLARESGETVSVSIDGPLSVERSKVYEVKTLEAEVVTVPEYVDLGLPSGVKWATFNVGATKPEEYGDYFAWGETEPYYKDGYAQSNSPEWKEGKSDGYDWSSYTFGTSSSGPFSKYVTDSSYGTVDNKTVLDLEDDAAHVNWGGSWRMPTDEEWKELIDNCTWTWTSDYNGTGVAGRIVTSNITGYTDKSIFLPAAGRRGGTGFSDMGSYGYFWSSSLRTGYPCDACNVYFYSDYFNWGRNYRYYGRSVRPVSD